MNSRLLAVIAPLAFFICGAVGIGLLYDVVADSERQRVRLETGITAEQVRLRLEAWIDSRTALVEHLGSGHFADNTDLDRNFRHDAETFVDLYPGIQAMNFIDRQWVIRKIVPAATNAPALDQDLHKHPNSAVVASLQIETMVSAGLVDKTWLWTEGPSQPGSSDVVQIADPTLYQVTYTSEGVVHVSADCNVANLPYEINSTGMNGGMLAQPGPVTLAECGPESSSNAFISSIQAAQDYRVQAGGNELELILPAGGGVLTLSLIHI